MPLFVPVFPLLIRWPYWSCFSSSFTLEKMSFLEKFEYCPSGISCKTPWTIGQLAGQRLKCYETALKAGGFVGFFFLLRD